MSMKNLYQTNKHYLEILTNIIYAPFPFPKNGFIMQESPPTHPQIWIHQTLLKNCQVIESE